MMSQDTTDFEENDRISKEEMVLLGELDEFWGGLSDTPLPDDFDAQMAVRVQARFDSLPLLERVCEKLLRILTLPFWRGWALLGSTFLVGMCVLLRVDLLLGYGAFLLSLVGSLKLIRRTWHDHLAPPIPERPALRAMVYYALPFIATAASGLIAGTVVSELSRSSLSFQGHSEAPMGVGILTGTAVFLSLTLALGPSWRAFRDNYHQSSARIFFLQLLHACWGFLLLSLLAETSYSYQLRNMLSESLPLDWRAALLGSLLVALFTTLLCRFYPPQIENMGSMKLAGYRTLKSLALVFLPIAAFLFGSYQLHLVEDLDDPQGFAAIAEQMEKKRTQAEAIPPEQNGWLVVKERYGFGDRSGTWNNEASRNLSRLSSHYLPVRERVRRDSKPTLLGEDREIFLGEISELERALKRPYFSHLATEGFQARSIMEKSILFRAAVTGLSVLMEQDAESSPDDSVDYGILALRLSGAEKVHNFAELMIQNSLYFIAIDSLEKVVLESSPSVQKLEDLAVVLEQQRPSQGCLAEAVKGDLYMMSLALNELVGFRSSSLIGPSGFYQQNSLLWTLLPWMPESYLESERKAYINMQMRRLSHLEQLTPLSDDRGSISPLNLSSASMSGNVLRGQLQVMLCFSRFDALRLEVALSRYRLENQHFPDSLEELVPTYLSELPVDMMDPKPLHSKTCFRYELSEEGYQLLSSSAVYHQLGLQSRQVFGHDGHLGLRPLRR